MFDPLAFYQYGRLAHRFIAYLRRVRPANKAIVMDVSPFPLSLFRLMFMQAAPRAPEV
jgi:hypothetical protein